MSERVTGPIGHNYRSYKLDGGDCERQQDNYEGRGQCVLQSDMCYGHLADLVIHHPFVVAHVVYLKIQ